MTPEVVTATISTIPEILPVELVWSTSMLLEDPVRSRVREWFAFPVCLLSRSLDDPSISILLVAPTTSVVILRSLEVPVITRSVFAEVAVAAAPCTNVRVLESPVSVRSKSSGVPGASYGQRGHVCVAGTSKCE
jgi:hypothetical protein